MHYKMSVVIDVVVSQVTLVSVQESGDGIPLIRDSGHEIRDYEIFEGGGRPARSNDFRKDAERHELGRERPASAIRASRELLTVFPVFAFSTSRSHHG